MKTFYSVVSLSPNIATKDSIAIGVILFDGKVFRYFFSDKKKRIASKMLPVELNIDFLHKQIVLKCEEFNREQDDNKLLYKFGNFSDASYFEYLSRYSNGLLQFSKPNLIDDGMISEDKFNKLTQYLFGENVPTSVEVSVAHHHNKELVIEEQLIEKVKDKVHTHYKFSELNMPGIYFPFEMDCIGRNGSLIGAKYIDFTKSAATLDTTINHYFTLISNLTITYDEKLADNNFYILSEEPSVIESKEHKIWDSIHKNPLVTVITPEESNVVAERIIDKKASVFLV